MKKINYIFGQTIGKNNLIFLEEKERCPDPSKKSGRRVARFFCTCGNIFESRIDDVISGKTKGCNCKKGKMIHHTRGELINGVEFIRSLGMSKDNKINFHRAVFKCPFCNKEWESYINNIQNGNTKSCGCMHPPGWERSRWSSFCKKAYLYKIRLFNDYESFIKIGITSHEDISKRYKSFPYDVEVIKIISGDIDYIFDLELRIKRMFKKYKYKPMLNFGGKTECYGY